MVKSPHHKHFKDKFMTPIQSYPINTCLLITDNISCLRYQGHTQKAKANLCVSHSGNNILLNRDAIRTPSNI